MDTPKVVEISIPGYTLEQQPDYTAVGDQIDRAIEQNFEGTFLARVLSVADHPKYTLDEFADVILRTGWDKYDPERKGVAHEEFAPYQPDIQAGEIVVEDGRLRSEPFSEDVRRFYENTLLDRGYRVRMDLIVLYDPAQLVRAEKLDASLPNVDSHLEEYLWRFRDPNNKSAALKGMIKIRT